MSWFSFSGQPSTAAKSPRLNLEALEVRENPAITIQLDYRYDTGFFTNPNDPNAAIRRATLQQVANELGSQLSANLGAITPSGGNNWSATFFNPANPSQTISLPGLVVNANTLIVFAAGGAGSGGEAGLGGFGGYTASGSTEWINTLRNRGPGFSLWGGAVSFSTSVNWNNGLGAPASNQLDFYSVASHEMAHVLGFGTAARWNTLAPGSVFTGQYASSVYGGNVPVSVTNPGHWREGLTYNGQQLVMDPSLNYGTRLGLSRLDYAALADLGWQVAGINLTASTTAATTNPATASTPSAAAVTTPAAAPAANPPTSYFAVSTAGNVQLMGVVNGAVTTLIGPFNPFPGFGGEIQATVGDVDGDGMPDLIVAPGSGGGPLIKVYSGRGGGMIAQFFAFSANFTGGVYLASGDFNRDGRADIVVGAGAGGGPNVRVFSGSTFQIMSDFFPIDPSFQGGVRVATGDINGDGTIDLITSAGFGGSAYVGIYDGRSLAFGNPTRLVNDFIALNPNLRIGCYIAAGDMNGDGFAELIVGAGEGGGPLVLVLDGRRIITQGGESAAANPYMAYFAGNPFSGTGVRVAYRDFFGRGRGNVIAATGVSAPAQIFITGLDFNTSSNIFGGLSLRSGLYVG